MGLYYVLPVHSATIILCRTTSVSVASGNSAAQSGKEKQSESGQYLPSYSNGVRERRGGLSQLSRDETGWSFQSESENESGQYLPS